MEKKEKRRRTKTSAFGSAGREGHDSSLFYSRKLYEGLPKEKKIPFQENALSPTFCDKIFNTSSEVMKELPDSSVHLVVTSPPYNIGKEYDANVTLPDYLNLLKAVFSEVKRVLVPSGRVCINVANLGRKPYIPLHAFIIHILHDLDFLMRGEVIWDKSASAGTSTAWGSWKSASNPTLRDVHEYILIFSKDAFKRLTPEERKSSISRDEFLDFTKSVWSFPTESAKKIGHPAPFPVELPYRCIQLYTYINELVLDPFIGSGQTAIAAIKANRHYVGYEVEAAYVELTERRIKEFKRTYHAPRLSDFMQPIGEY